MSRRRSGGWGASLPSPHIWLTLGYRGIEQGDGKSLIEWDANPEYCFQTESGPIVHGGMVTTLLDTAMGGACWTLTTTFSPAPTSVLMMLSSSVQLYCPADCSTAVHSTWCLIHPNPACFTAPTVNPLAWVLMSHMCAWKP